MAGELGVEVEFAQRSGEGELVECSQGLRGRAQALARAAVADQREPARGGGQIAGVAAEGGQARACRRAVGGARELAGVVEGERHLLAGLYGVRKRDRDAQRGRGALKRHRLAVDLKGADGQVGIQLDRQIARRLVGDEIGLDLGDERLVAGAEGGVDFVVGGVEVGLGRRLLRGESAGAEKNPDGRQGPDDRLGSKSSIRQSILAVALRYQITPGELSGYGVGGWEWGGAG